MISPAIGDDNVDLASLSHYSTPRRSNISCNTASAASENTFFISPSTANQKLNVTSANQADQRAIQTNIAISLSSSQQPFVIPHHNNTAKLSEFIQVCADAQASLKYLSSSRNFRSGILSSQKHAATNESLSSSVAAVAAAAPAGLHNNNSNSNNQWEADTEFSSASLNTLHEEARQDHELALRLVKLLIAKLSELCDEFADAQSRLGLKSLELEELQQKLTSKVRWPSGSQSECASSSSSHCSAQLLVGLDREWERLEQREARLAGDLVTHFTKCRMDTGLMTSQLGQLADLVNLFSSSSSNASASSLFAATPMMTQQLQRRLDESHRQCDWLAGKLQQEMTAREALQKALGKQQDEYDWLLERTTTHTTAATAEEEAAVRGGGPIRLHAASSGTQSVKGGLGFAAGCSVPSNLNELSLADELRQSETKREMKRKSPSKLAKQQQQQPIRGGRVEAGAGKTASRINQRDVISVMQQVGAVNAAANAASMMSSGYQGSEHDAMHDAANNDADNVDDDDDDTEDDDVTVRQSTATTTSTNSSMTLSSLGCGGSGGFAGAPSKLRIVKPLAGSRTLRHWQNLAAVQGLADISASQSEPPAASACDGTAGDDATRALRNQQYEQAELRHQQQTELRNQRSSPPSQSHWLSKLGHVANRVLHKISASSSGGSGMMTSSSASSTASLNSQTQSHPPTLMQQLAQMPPVARQRHPPPHTQSSQALQRHCAITAASPPPPDALPGAPPVTSDTSKERQTAPSFSITAPHSSYKLRLMPPGSFLCNLTNPITAAATATSNQNDVHHHPQHHPKHHYEADESRDEDASRTALSISSRSSSSID